VTSRLGTGKSLFFFYSARTDLSLGGVLLGPFVVAGLQADCVRTVRMQGVGIHIPGGDTLALALYTHFMFTFADQRPNLNTSNREKTRSTTSSRSRLLARSRPLPIKCQP
jgi:hypothetical protein